MRILNAKNIDFWSTIVAKKRPARSQNRRKKQAKIERKKIMKKVDAEDAEAARGMGREGGVPSKT